MFVAYFRLGFVKDRLEVSRSVRARNRKKIWFQWTEIDKLWQAFLNDY